MTKFDLKSGLNNLIIRTLLTLVVFCPALVINNQSVLSGLTVQAEEKTKKKIRKTPALREKIYSQLARAQKLADDDKINEGLAVLNRLKQRENQLNSYEKAMMWNFFGFIHYGNNDMPKVVEAFAQVIAQKNIPESLELSTVFSLAQLNMQAENYKETLNLLERWSKVKQKPLNAKGLILQANAHYAMKNYAKALNSIDGAIAEKKAADKLPKENWLVLKRALHYELKQPQRVANVCEDLVRYYSKPKYWVELANMYGELDKGNKQLAVMEAAYQQGFVTKKADVRSLAQLYYFSGAPYKAAKLMAENLAKGILEKDINTLQFLAQAWIGAKENGKAIPVLKQAASLSDDGNMDARLAEVLLNLERWQEAIDVAKSAQQKGQLENPGNLAVAMGMAYFNQKKFPQAIDSFQQATKHEKVQKTANQWLKYVQVEQRKEEQMKQLISAVNLAKSIKES